MNYNCVDHDWQLDAVVDCVCVSANIYQKINTTAGLSSIASLSLLVSMSMSGLGGRPLLPRPAGTPTFSTLIPPFRYRRSSGSSGCRSLQAPASAVLERRRLSTTTPPPTRRQPSPPTVTTTTHETSLTVNRPAPVDFSDVDLLVDVTADCRQEQISASTLLIPDQPITPLLIPSSSSSSSSSYHHIPDLPVMGQSRSDNVLSVSDRDFQSFKHATSNGFLHTT